MLSLTEKVGLSSQPNVLDRETEMIESLPLSSPSSESCKSTSPPPRPPSGLLVQSKINIFNKRQFAGSSTTSDHGNAAALQPWFDQHGQVKYGSVTHQFLVMLFSQRRQSLHLQHQIHFLPRPSNRQTVEVNLCLKTVSGKRTQ